MEQAFSIATLWFGLALIATFLAARLKISMALMEIIVGMAAAAAIGHFFGKDAMGADLPGLRFLASTGAVLLTFLAGAELEPAVMRRKWKEVSVVGAVGFLAPFLGCAAVARFVLGWSAQSSWLGRHRALDHVDGGGLRGDAGDRVQPHRFRQRHPGSLLRERSRDRAGPRFDVRSLHLAHRNFRGRRAWRPSCSCPLVTPHLMNHYANRTAAFRTKWVLFILFGLGALALWSGSEAVLPAYIAGMVLASTLGTDHVFVRRLRTLTIGFLTPIYFLRAGSFVSVPALLSAPLVFLALFGGKVGTKIFGLYPVIGAFRRERNERWYYTLMMSTGLTFGTISALYGLNSRAGHPAAVFAPGRGGHRLSRGAHLDRQCGVPAAAPSPAAGCRGAGLQAPRPSRRQDRLEPQDSLEDG